MLKGWGDKLLSGNSSAPVQMSFLYYQNDWIWILIQIFSLDSVSVLIALGIKLLRTVPVYHIFFLGSLCRNSFWC